MRAGWEEAGILMRRKPLQSLIEDPQLDTELKRKFQLVLDAREFAKQSGLKPGGSYTKYSAVDRDVLVWVLNAAPKTSLQPKTWWFPIVGRVPYKGYFHKEQGVSAAEELKAEGYDVYLRPSPAMSTLGWFDDPLLSTIVRFDDVSLVETVIHEILHNTIWVRNDVIFNESLANFVGAKGAELYFSSRGNEGLAKTASERWADEKVYAQFLEITSKKLETLYESDLSGDAKLAKRETIFAEAYKDWDSDAVKTNMYKEMGLKLNNASIGAHRIYMTRLDLFDQAYALCGNSLDKFLEFLKALAKNGEGEPYVELREAVAGKRCHEANEGNE